MFRKIIVGYDDSDQAKDAVALGKQIAEATGAELTLVGVSQFDPMWREWDPHFREIDEEFRRELRAAAEAVGAEAKHVPSSSPARGLHEAAEDAEADLIVVGSARHGRVGQILAGSTALAVLHGAPCAIAIAPRGYRDRAGDGLGQVAVGFDGSEESGQALLTASRLAADADAQLKLITVAVPPPETFGEGGMTGWHALLEAITDQARERLAEGCDAVPDGVDADGTLVTGDPVKALSDAGREPGTMMVVGSRAYGPVRRVLLGSVSTPLVRSAPCPVIVTPRGVHENAERKPAAAVGIAS